MTPLQMLQGIKNPQQFVMNMLGKNINNPMFGNLLQMANNGDTKGVETFARNVCKEKGIDFDKEFSSFMTNFKG